MKNLYIIYGCNKYWDRLRSSKDTWMRNMGPNEDYIILGETPVPELKMVGFPSDDGKYLNLGMRTLMFLDTYSDFLKQWDWITFVDDDAYLFRDRLKKRLAKEDKQDRSIVVGKTPGERIINANSSPVRFTLMHGGATISLNKLATERMLRYLNENREWLYNKKSVDKAFYYYGDVCVSFLCRKSRATIVNCPYQMSYLHHKFNRMKHSDYYSIISSHNIGHEDKQKLYKIDLAGRN